MYQYILLLIIFFSFVYKSGANEISLNKNLSKEIVKLSREANKISKERKKRIEELATYVANKLNQNKEVNIIFICTHNSRRSHISQLWALAISNYYGITNINCYSGGTEVTAFNHRSVKALRKVGFEIEKMDTSSNPRYICRIGENLPEIISFSKKYDDPSNPQNEFIAVMVCSDADHNCPYIPTAESRFSLNYEDPKRFDNTLREEKEYDNTVQLIGREITYLFKMVKDKLKK